ncbi:MAG: efflux RND transporter permease subunit [Deltaproteobacteria bacterium]|nr:efflux RND transporter permease subunit [Deltaproteobacteria bacterium]
MSLASFAVKQPVLVNTLFVAALIMGLVAAGDMPRERYPSTPMNKIFAIIIYPGTSPSEMETLVAIPLEEKLRDVDDLDWMNTTCFEGKTVVEMKYEDDLPNLKETEREVRTKVSEADLPEDILDPIILPVITDEVMPALQIAMGGDFSDTTIKELAENLKKELLNVEDASEVELSGARDREIWVEVDPTRSEEFRIPFSAIDEALAMRNLNLPAGKVTLGDEEYILRTMGEFTSIEQIRDVVIHAEADGQMVRLRDIAEIRDTFAEERVRRRLDSNPTVLLTVYKKSGGNVMGLVDEVKEISDRFSSRVPGLTVSYRSDESISVREALQVLGSNALLGCVLVVLCLVVLMSFRASVLALLGIPFTFLATFVVLHFLGFTMNTLTMFACILVLGMVVDDAIIIIENVHRHIESGMDRVTAAVVGTNEVAWPVFSAILTTMAAFLPMLMMDVMIGQFLWNFPVIVSLCLGMSLVEAFLILPSHLSHFGPRAAEAKPRRVFVALVSAYRKILKPFVHHRYLATLGFLLFAALAIFLVMMGLRSGYIAIEMFASEDTSTITMNIELPVGTSLDETEEIADTLETRILSMEGKPVKSIVTSVGNIIDEHRWVTQTHLAQFDMDLGTLRERQKRSGDLKQAIRKLAEDVPGIQRTWFVEMSTGPPVGHPVEIRVFGDDPAELKRHVLDIQEMLREVPGVVDIRDTLAPGKDELRIVPREDQAALMGMSNAAIAATVRNAFEGHAATQYRDEGGNEVDVVVKLRPESGSSVEDVRSLRLMTPKGPVRLDQIARIEVARGVSELHRRDGDRFAGVSAGVDKSVTTSDAANVLMKEKLGDFEVENPGYRLAFGGEAEEQAKSFSSLYRAFLVSILLIYIILGAQFKSFVQPLVVMTAVPFSFIGVFIGLMVMGLPFSLIALISVVGLAGVVVNDSLVLVDFANRVRDEGRHHVEAAIEAGCVRVRPILMTSITTIGGLMPLALGLGGASSMWKPMAISMAWGLGFASLLTLFVIPALYAIVGDVTSFFSRKMGRGTDQMK